MSALPHRPDVVVFDWDNTLVDTWPTIHESLNITLEAMGHEPWSLEETRSRVRHSLRDSFPLLFGERWTEARDVFYDAFSRTHIARLSPMAGAQDLLASFFAVDIHMAVLSNKTGRFLRQEAEHLGWSGYFGRIVGAGDAARDKPARESLELALKHIGLGPGAGVWVVGDAGIDMEIAHRTGCVPVLLHRQDYNSEEFVNWPPRYCFTSCESLINLVTRW